MFLTKDEILTLDPSVYDWISLDISSQKQAEKIETTTNYNKVVSERTRKKISESMKKAKAMSKSYNRKYLESQSWFKTNSN